VLGQELNQATVMTRVIDKLPPNISIMFELATRAACDEELNNDMSAVIKKALPNAIFTTNTQTLFTDYKFTGTSPSTIRIFKHSSNTSPKIELFNPIASSSLDEKETHLKASFQGRDAKCILHEAEWYEYGEEPFTETIHAIHRFQRDGTVINLKYSLDSNKKLNPDKVAGCNQSPMDELLDDILKLEADVMEVVTLIDSGVDYTIASIAPSIYRVYDYLSDDEKKETDRELAYYKELKAAYESRGWMNPDWGWATQRELRALEHSLHRKLGIGIDKVDGDFFAYAFHNGHGTAVGGEIVRGSDRVKIFPIRRPSSEQIKQFQLDGNLEKIEEIYSEMIDDGKKVGSKVFNLSFGTDSETLCPYINAAINKHSDVLFVAAAGNDGQNLSSKKSCPADQSSPSNHIISVGSYNALTQEGAIDPQSGHDDSPRPQDRKVDFMAAGVNIPVLGQTGILTPQTGSSISAGTVTRAAARMRMIDSSLTPKKIKEILCDTVTKKDYLTDTTRCGGVLNEHDALVRVHELMTQN
jgi:hypothetical protein